MDYESLNIQWFPGHMARARRMITDSLRMVDAVCEVIDARIPFSSRNPDLDKIAGAKPRLIVLNRMDQADPVATKAWHSKLKESGAFVLESDSKSGVGLGGFPAAVRTLLADRIEYYASKGQVGRQLRLMVVGIPNVGKSSLINRVAKRKATATSDKPGVTRGKQWIKIDNGLEILDTPGVLWPKFEDQVVAENLAFTGAIRDEVMDLESLGFNFMMRMKEFYPEAIRERYKVEIDADSKGHDLLEQAAKNRNFLISGGEADLGRMAAVLLDEFRSGKLGRVTLEHALENV